MSEYKLLFCKNCGAEVTEDFRFCEKCFVNLSIEGAVVNNFGLASDAAGRAVESGDFIPDAFIGSYDFSGCLIGNYRLSEKTDSFLGSDYYSAVDISNGKKICVRYMNISEMYYSDRYALILGKKAVNIPDLAVRLCNDEMERFKRACKLCSLPCPNLGISSFLSSNKKECHMFFHYNDLMPLSLKIKQQHISVRDVIKISLDICGFLLEFERNNILFGSVFESNIFIDNNGSAVPGAEFDRALQRCFIDSPAAIGYSMYIPADCRLDDNGSIYSLAVMLYKMFNGGRLPYMNYFNDNPNYFDLLKAEHDRSLFLELQMPINAENMLGNMLSGIIGNKNWRDIKISDVKKTLENALNYLSAPELDRKIN